LLSIDLNLMTNICAYLL